MAEITLPFVAAMTALLLASLWNASIQSHCKAR
jgi:hypothetical protein